MQDTDEPHATVHDPQNAGSDSKSTHCPLQRVWPEGHVHLPFVQRSPAPHAAPQPPQFKTSVRVSTHLPLQDVTPLAHSCAPGAHVTAPAAVFRIVQRVLADSVARHERRPAPARGVDAALADRTRSIASAAVVRVEPEVHAVAVAIRLLPAAARAAATSRAHLTRVAGVAARAAVLVVRLQIGAGSRAEGISRWAATCSRNAVLLGSA